mmetsp:Transcript_7736/g.23237  ORF Transcript_7736/g.23237 Transcript_7736/m.23237 type:complete len:153 (-) Transcript_7736:586-1044(-)
MYAGVDDEMGFEDRIPLWKSLAFVFLPALVAFVVVDGVFIVFVAGPMFKDALQDTLRTPPNMLAGVAAWLCIVGLVYMFALPRARKTATSAFLQGVIAGFCLYGTYELTNMSVIAPWRWSIVAADMAWGSFACGVSCALMQVLQTTLASGLR